MNIEKYTERARGFIQSAQTFALGKGHQQFLPIHLLKVLLDDGEGLASGLIENAGGDAKVARADTEAGLRKVPSVSGDNSQLYLSREIARVFDTAESAAQKAGDRLLISALPPPAALGACNELAGALVRRLQAINPGLHISAMRVRKAWLVEQIATWDKLHAFLEASGLKTAHSVDELRPFWPEVGLEPARIAELLGGISRSTGSRHGDRERRR